MKIGLMSKKELQMRQIYGHLEGHGTENPQFLNLPYQDLPLLDIK